MFKPPTAKQLALARELEIEVNPKEVISRHRLSRLLELKLWQLKAEWRRQVLQEKGIRVGTRVRYHMDPTQGAYEVSYVGHDFSVNLKGRLGSYNPSNLEVVTD